MSISGVRTAYDDEEIGQATQILGRPCPSNPPAVTADRHASGSVPGVGSYLEEGGPLNGEQQDVPSADERVRDGRGAADDLSSL